MCQLTSMPASQTEMVLRRVVMPNMLNPNGTMFGGALLSIYDEFSGIVGLGLVKGKIMTVSIENVTFSRPICAGETVVIRGRITYTGRSSFVVQLDTETERNGVSLGHAGSAVFNYVAIGDDGRPTMIPQLILETDEDRQLWEEAEARRKTRRK